MSDNQTLTSSELARAAGVGVETVRYYERRGLLVPPKRNASGHRTWAERDRRRLMFIRRAQQHGFQLEEIGELLALRIEADRPCDDVVQAADRVIRRIDRKIRELEGMRRALIPLRDACPGDGASGPCPILDALDEEGNS